MDDDFQGDDQDNITTLLFKQSFMSYFLREDSVNRSDGCKLKEIPQLNSPEKISQLNLAYNQIRAIPHHISCATNLQMIDLSHNKISKLENILEVSSLKFINLSHNLIFEVPEKIVQLVELQNLDLGFNRISIMNNIRVLKNLVQLRTFQYKGFIEINLEGNQVLKKKGCRQIYKKWMNPSIQECRKMNNRSCYQNAIARTERRMSKSLEAYPISKENTLMETKKSLVLPQKNITMASFHPPKQTIAEKNKENNNNTSQGQLSDHLTQSPNFINYQEVKENHEHSNELIGLPAKSQMLKSGHNIKDLSSILQEKEGHMSSQWFTICSTKLKELTNIFTLIITNDDIKVLDKEVKDKIVEQSLYAKEIVNISLDAIELVLHEHFTVEDSQKYVDDFGMMFDKIKDIHKETISIFNTKDYLPIKLYKPWVTYFRQLKHLVLSIPPKIRLYHSKCQRDKQIQDLISISPEKMELEILPPDGNKKGSGVKVKPNIDDLLFSKQKQDFLLLSDCKRSNSQKRLMPKDEGECQSCLVMKWQNNKNKEEVREMIDRVQELQKEKSQYLDQLKQLSQIKKKYLTLISKQGIIIEELETIKPSTYQNMLLQQAKTIQYMIGLEPLVFNSKELPIRKSINGSVSVGSEKEQQVLNTRLSSGKPKKESVIHSKKVSEFTVEGGGSANRGSSYFKNKNVITTINRTGDEYKSLSNGEKLVTESNQQGSQTMKRGQIVVSQFNSEGNSMDDDKKEKSCSKVAKGEVNKNLKRRSSGKQSSQSKSKTIQKQKTQNDVILISEQSALKYSPQSSYPVFSSKTNKNQSYIEQQQYQKLLEQKLITDKTKKGDNRTESYNKFGGQIHLQKDKSKKKRISGLIEGENKENVCPQKVKKTKTTELLDHFHLNRYKEHGYVPMESIEADNYKKYMQYHLRNNIIDILSKKAGNSSKFQRRYLNGAKSQKLIHKRSESELLNNAASRSKGNDINQTFR